jgi:hypothetical protein
MADRQRREFQEALLDADSFEDLPGKWQAAILEAEAARPPFRVVTGGYATLRAAAQRVAGGATRGEAVSEEREQEGQPESAEGEEGSKLSKKIPDEASGEGETPLGATDEHSDAPGPHGTG